MNGPLLHGQYQTLEFVSTQIGQMIVSPIWFHYCFVQSHSSRPDCAAHPHKKVGLHLTVIVRLPLPGVIWHWVAVWLQHQWWRNHLGWLELVHTIFWHIFCPKYQSQKTVLQFWFQYINLFDQSLICTW